LRQGEEVVLQKLANDLGMPEILKPQTGEEE